MTDGREPLTEFEIHLLARLYAHQTLIVFLMRALMADAKLDAPQRDRLRETFDAIAEAKTYPNLDPVQSDHLSSEGQGALDRLWTKIIDGLSQSPS
jgi:hypothetical protein